MKMELQLEQTPRDEPLTPLTVYIPHETGCYFEQLSPDCCDVNFEGFVYHEPDSNIIETAEAWIYDQ